MSRTLSIDFLRTFIAIADAGTFAAAAERVGRTVSAVSLQIDRLEEQVGRALFEKSGRRMEPTSAGRQLLADQRIAFYAFTGSTQVGREIQQAAGLRGTQLELGSIASTIATKITAAAAEINSIVSPSATSGMLGKVTPLRIIQSLRLSMPKVQV